MLAVDFFNQDAVELAKALLGKVLRVKQGDIWLSAIIIETEAYYLTDKASHASLGYTVKRKALFMPPGTIYMYYARGGDSLNISSQGEGNAVLIKSAFPYLDNHTDNRMISIMQQLNPYSPLSKNSQLRPIEKLCAGQTLLCKSLGLKVPDWDQKNFDPQRFFIEDVHYSPKITVAARRLGIAAHRDPHHFYRFIDHQYIKYATDNPLRKKNYLENRDYFMLPDSG